MARPSNIALKRFKVFLLGVDAQVRKRKRHFHASQHVLQAIFFLLKPIEIQLTEQANGNNFPVKGLLRLFGKERSHPVIYHMGNLSLVISPRSVGDNAGNGHRGKNDIFQGLSYPTCPVVLNSLLPATIKNVIGVAREVIRGIQIDVR